MTTTKDTAPFNAGVPRIQSNHPEPGVKAIASALTRIKERLEAWKEHHEMRARRLPDSECQADWNIVANYNHLIVIADDALAKAGKEGLV